MVLVSDNCCLVLTIMSLKSPSSSLYKLVDVPVTPDDYHTKHYETTHRTRGTTIVIDNGSCQCKAGWAGEERPCLVFRNAVAKTRGKRGEADGVCIGNDIANVEAVRSTLKNQFDRNVVTNFSVQEQILDHTFSHLGLGADTCIPHSVVMTEPVCNPTHSRCQMSELLFECYGIPAVAYGVDALFSAHQNMGCEVKDSLIVSSGHQTTHILPVLDGKLDSVHCKRINLGGMQTTGCLQRLLQLKYPDLQLHITLSGAREMLHRHGYVALDYGAELRAWATPTEQEQLDYRVIQLPYNQSAVGSVVTDVSREAKDKQRRERARQQLLKLNKKKREDKIASLLKELNQHLELQHQRETVDVEEYLLMLEEAGHDSEESLSSAVQQLEGQLEVEQEKLATLVRNLAMDSSQQQQEVGVSEEWLESLKERRKELLESKRQRQTKKAELGKRRSAASQNRMRIISSLGAEVSVKKGKSSEDTFGMDDDDWNVYRTIDRHAEDSDSEREEMELGEIVKLLEKHDPSYMRGSTVAHSSSADLAACYQLVLGVERFRAPEIVFQPTMVGVDQSGLAETLDFVLQYYPPDIQQRLVQNVFVTGGNSLHTHFTQRLEEDLRAMRPFKSSFHVSAAGDPLLDAWRGGGMWAESPANLDTFVTRDEYMEKGAEFMKQHSASNIPLTVSATH